MLHKQRNENDTASQWLQKSVDWIEQAQRGQLANPVHQIQWKAASDDIKRLRREAEELILSSAAKIPRDIAK